MIKLMNGTTVDGIFRSWTKNAHNQYYATIMVGDGTVQHYSPMAISAESLKTFPPRPCDVEKTGKDLEYAVFLHKPYGTTELGTSISEGFAQALAQLSINSMRVIIGEDRAEVDTTDTGIDVYHNHLDGYRQHVATLQIIARHHTNQYVTKAGRQRAR